MKLINLNGGQLNNVSTLYEVTDSGPNSLTLSTL